MALLGGEEGGAVEGSGVGAFAVLGFLDEDPAADPVRGAGGPDVFQVGDGERGQAGGAAGGGAGGVVGDGGQVRDGVFLSLDCPLMYHTKAGSEGLRERKERGRPRPPPPLRLSAPVPRGGAWGFVLRAGQDDEGGPAAAHEPDQAGGQGQQHVLHQRGHPEAARVIVVSIRRAGAGHKRTPGRPVIRTSPGGDCVGVSLHPRGASGAPGWRAARSRGAGRGPAPLRCPRRVRAW